MERTLNITGTGKISLTPDLAVINFPLSCVDFDYAAALKSLNKTVAQLKEILAKPGIEPNQLKTHDFRVDRETRYNKNRETYEFIGYNARHDLSLEIPFDNALIHQILLEIVKLDHKIDSVFISG